MKVGRPRQSPTLGFNAAGDPVAPSIGIHSRRRLLQTYVHVARHQRGTTTEKGLDSNPMKMPVGLLRSIPHRFCSLHNPPHRSSPPSVTLSSELSGLVRNGHHRTNCCDELRRASSVQSDSRANCNNDTLAVSNHSQSVTRRCTSCHTFLQSRHFVCRCRQQTQLCLPSDGTFVSVATRSAHPCSVSVPALGHRASAALPSFTVLLAFSHAVFFDERKSGRCCGCAGRALGRR